MEEIILNAAKRTDKPKKVRQAGLIPGVLNEAHSTSTSVQFPAGELNKIITRHGPNARVWLKMGRAKKKFGYIKEIQRDPVSQHIIHITLQLVSVDQLVKMQIPISYHGQDELEHNKLFIQSNKADVDVTGKASVMPDVVVVNVSDKEDGDAITQADFELENGIEVTDPEDEIYAMIKAIRENIEPETEGETEETPEVPVVGGAEEDGTASETE